ncbi:hypothetical protein [Rhodococcus jostii]|uniref:hypothetical protein n=1 Tax=Rhodococcus jostii TaxID=132919 RepID=UPI0036689F26
MLTERIDRVHIADGSVAIEIPIMGSFVVTDGKLARYSDYNGTRLSGNDSRDTPTAPSSHRGRNNDC